MSDTWSLIDWSLVFFGGLWVLGLAAALTAFGFAYDRAGRERLPLRQALGQPVIQRALNAGFMLFCLGWAGLVQAWWERALWLLLAASFLWQAWPWGDPRAWPSAARARLAAWRPEWPRPSRWLMAALALALARGLLYVLLVPPWQHPDEPTHFEHVRLVTDLGRLPKQDEFSLPVRRQLADSMLRHDFWRGIQQPALDDAALSQVGYTPLGIYTLSQPRGYYALAGLWLWPWRGLSIEGQLYALRLLSVVFNLGVVALTWRLARLAFPERLDLALGALAALIFHPGYTDLMAAANNDALANLLGAWFVLNLLRVYRQGASAERLLWVLVSLLAAWLVKATSLTLAAAAGAALALYPLSSLRGRARAAWLALLAAGGALGVGALLGARLWPAEWVNAINAYFRIDLLGTLHIARDPASLGRYREALLTVFQSFWAAFGWRNVLISRELYGLAFLGLLGALAGLLAQAWAWQRRGRPAAWQAGFVGLGLASGALALAITVVRGMAAQGDYVYLSHGRYLYVLMPLFAMLFARGWLGGLPVAWRRPGWLIYGLIWCLFDAAAFWGYLAQHFARG